MMKPTPKNETPSGGKAPKLDRRHHEDALKMGWAEKLIRNAAVVGILALTVSAVHNAGLPSGQSVVTAVQEMIQGDWDSQLGKISFVSNLLPETVSVFFEAPYAAVLAAPAQGKVLHAWSEGEPYLGYDAGDGRVFAASEGQVMSVAHGMDEERVVRVRQRDGLECLYYGLEEALVREGDQVTADTCLGRLLPGQEAVIEVRRYGRAIDPTDLLRPRGAQEP